MVKLDKMKITKYPQSCLLIESKGKKILIDPGILFYDESFFEEWEKADVILITHKHVDHCHAEVIKRIINNKKTIIYSSNEVQQTYPDLPINIVKESEIFEFEEIKIEVVKAVHGYIPPLRGGKEINENIGFILTIEGKRIYVTSDTICFKNDYKCDILALSISIHGVAMGVFESALFAQETEASLILLIHMDNAMFPVNKNEVIKRFEEMGLNYKLMEFEESIEI
jgi:L-ascorbate metabolism protein UlaG (beta-lactamase superfamily)